MSYFYSSYLLYGFPIDELPGEIDENVLDERTQLLNDKLPASLSNRLWYFTAGNHVAGKCLRCYIGIEVRLDEIDATIDGVQKYLKQYEPYIPGAKLYQLWEYS